MGSTDAEFLGRALALAAESVRSGGGPFGAVVSRGGQIFAEGMNRVVPWTDPTAHAEVVAIRAAAKAAGDFSLRGFELFTSCEPCPMCLGACCWARLDRVVYAASREDAAAAGFDDRLFHDELHLPPERRSVPVVRSVRPDATAPFEEWRRFESAEPY